MTYHGIEFVTELAFFGQSELSLLLGFFGFLAGRSSQVITLQITHARSIVQQVAEDTSIQLRKLFYGLVSAK
jgi:hypothetical protein